MSYRLLDINGKPIPKKGRKSKNLPAERMERGVKMFHYAITVAIKGEGGKYKHILRHKWLPDDVAAAEVERELRRGAPVKALTWEKAHGQWLDDVGAKRSPRHLVNVAATMARWLDSFGTNKSIEGTSLGEFTAWMRERSKSGKGRGAQLDQAHLLTIARWARDNGLVEKVPFEYAPMPENRIEERTPASRADYFASIDLLPHHISLLWQMLGLTGMRLGAACGLLEADIGVREFTVTTKGDKRVTYPVTPPIRDIIAAARAWKAEQGFVKTPYLFCNIHGNHWTSTTVGKRIAAILDGDKGRPKITAHQLRHMAGTIMGEKNLSVPTIMAALGHSNAASSQVYIDKTRKMRGTGMNALIKNLSKNDPKSDFSKVILDDAKLSKIAKGVVISCPDCGCNLLIIKKKKAQP